MASSFQQAALRRKVIYIGVIIALFTVSLFWRGKLSFPAFAAAASRQTVAGQAQRLELRELDQGDPEIAASAARLSLLGMRGLVVTALWKTAIEKQTRNEFHEFELLVKLVTRLQPNFIAPWIFQSWNIAYNVSVENDKLGDMYYYIARGIELLAEGDRLNTKEYAGKPIGSPDMRYQIGFYYQNKFGVSDKVQTLRSLAQLSVIPPDERNAEIIRRPAAVADPNYPDRMIETPWAKHQPWVDFCKKNPQLLWRLKTKLNLTNPEQIVNFLKDNEKIPARYLPSGEVAAANDQFPAFPPRFNDDDYDPTGKRVPDDTYDPFHAARAWFNYSMQVVPPPQTGPKGTSFEGRAIPWSTPSDFNPFLYRLPRAPAYVIFTQYPARAQTYLAARLGDEGWFDQTSSWAPDARANPSDYWLKVDDTEPDVYLTTPASSQAEYQRAYTMWQEHGERLAMDLKLSDILNLTQLAQPVRGDPNSLPPDYTPEQMESLGISPANYIAKKSLVYYGQNRSMTNFPYFLAMTEGEQADVTIAARKLLWKAEREKQYGRNSAAIDDYVAGLAKWREALSRFPQFHRPERSETTEEKTYEFEIELIDLLRGEGFVRRRADAIGQAARAIAPGLPDAAGEDLLQAVAEDEAATLVAVASATQNEQFRRRLTETAKQESLPLAGQTQFCAYALAGFAAEAPGQLDSLTATVAANSAAKSDFVRELLEREFAWMKEYKSELKDDPWVKPEVKSIVLNRLGRVRAPSGSSEPPPEGGDPAADPSGS